MQKLIKVLIAADLLVANSADANGIDVKAAYDGALEFVAIKILIAAIVFYLISFGLINKPKDTATKNGRWIGAILSAAVIASSTNHYSKQSEYIYSLCLAVLGLYVVGFFVGYLWFKFKPIKGSNADNINVKTYVNKKVFLPILAIISIGIVFWFFGYNGIGKAAIYDVYHSCKSVGKDCSESFGTVTFKVDKEKSQVISIFKSLQDGWSNIIKLENCFVVDEHTWQCQNEITDNISISRTWSMIEDKVTMSDGMYTFVKR
ncbi:hypothetical protein MCEMSEM29_01946 [Methylophilaceae bacterium]